MIKTTAILLTSFLLVGICHTTNAQNSIEVSQNGSGNSVSVNQSDNATQPSAKNECSEFESAVHAKGSNNLGSRVHAKGKGNGNRVVVQSADAPADTVLAESSNTRNSVSTLLDRLLALTASQQGSGNGLFITLPHSMQQPGSLTANQKGEENTIAAHYGNSPDRVELSQNGEGNDVSINPCNDRDDQKPGDASQNNTTVVKQSGNGNSVSINQQ